MLYLRVILFSHQLQLLVKLGLKEVNVFYLSMPEARVAQSDYGLDDQTIEVQSLAEARRFSSNLCVQTGSGAHKASCQMGTRGPFPGCKARLEHDADHSPPTSAEVING
jgi:hypothetical protein